MDHSSTSKNIFVNNQNASVPKSNNKRMERYQGSQKVLKPQNNLASRQNLNEGSNYMPRRSPLRQRHLDKSLAVKGGHKNLH